MAFWDKWLGGAARKEPVEEVSQAMIRQALKMERTVERFDLSKLILELQVNLKKATADAEELKKSADKSAEIGGLIARVTEHVNRIQEEPSLSTISKRDLDIMATEMGRLGIVLDALRETEEQANGIDKNLSGMGKLIATIQSRRAQLSENLKKWEDFYYNVVQPTYYQYLVKGGAGYSKRGKRAKARAREERGVPFMRRM